MAYANTNGIKLEKFDTKDKAINFLKKMVVAWQTELVKRGWKNQTLDYDFFSKIKKVRELRAKFVSNIYESSVISALRNKIRPEIEKELRKAGRTETGSTLNNLVGEIGEGLVYEEKTRFKDIAKFLLKNSNNARWWKRRNIERDRIAAACSVFDGTGSLETSDLNENPFGDGTDKPVLDEEYCFICEKLIKEDDKTSSFTGTDFIAHAGFCYDQGRGSKADENGKYPHFHQCSFCPRQIPKKIGNTCRTCQEKNKGLKVGECLDCHQNKPIFRRRRGSSPDRGYCQECFNDIPLCAYCKNYKCWGEKRGGGKVFASSLEGGKGLFFHSRECVENWEEEQKRKNRKPSLQQLRQRYVQKLSDLSGWGSVLSEDERDRFKEMIFQGFSESVFKDAILQARNLIQSKKDDEDDGEKDRFFQSEIQKFILEISSKINQEPRVNGEEVDFDLVSWQDYLLGSADFDQLVSRKKEILSNIDSIRRRQKGQGNLSQVQEEAIQEIREELAKNPPIKNEELTNRDWENDINEASDVLIINQIRSKILVEIRNKRMNDSEKNDLNELLLRAREPQNWNDYSNLFSVLREIKKLHASNFYQEKESEVEVIESQLQTLNPEQFEESIEQLLNFQVKDNGLNDSNTSEEVKQAIDDWKTNPTRENLVKAEEAICQNAADNIIAEICQEVGTKLSEGKLSKKGAKKLVDKIQEIISKNDYRALAYEKNRKTVDNFLERLSRWEEDELEEQSLLPKWFWPVAITSCLGIAVVGVALWMKERNKAKSDHNKY